MQIIQKLKSNFQQEVKATELVLSTYPFLPNVNSNLILEKDYETLGHKKRILKKAAQQLIDVSSIENPIQISLNSEKIRFE